MFFSTNKKVEIEIMNSTANKMNSHLIVSTASALDAIFPHI